MRLGGKLAKSSSFGHLLATKPQHLRPNRLSQRPAPIAAHSTSGMPKSNERNVLGGSLEVCSTDPMTGWTRNGCCETGPMDYGSHVVAAQVTSEFLEYTKSRGNDLGTPVPAYGFPGLKPGDRWCLCASRWYEAMQAGCAPPVILKATNVRALDVISLEELKKYAIDNVETSSAN